MDKCKDQFGNGDNTTTAQGEMESVESSPSSAGDSGNVGSCDSQLVGENQPEWQYKTQFAINKKMLEILEATKKACEAEKAQLLRKLQKLTYGS